MITSSVLARLRNTLVTLHICLLLFTAFTVFQMCQVGEEFKDQLERPPLPSVSKKCVKCKEGIASVVIRAGDAFCRGCFKEYFVHKFRAMLGKNRVIFPAEKVLLAVSGGPSSCSMLSQVQEGLSQTAHKKLRFLPGIVYIDEGGAFSQSVEERQAMVSELQTVFRATGFPFHIVPLEQVLDLPSSVVVTAPSPSEQPASVFKAAVDSFIKNNNDHSLTPTEQEETRLPDVYPASHTQLLQKLIASAKTPTAREDLLNTLRQHLLVHTARTAGYSKLMLGDSCTRLAVKLLVSISLGRGAQLAQDTGFSDSRYGDVILVRPMRDYLDQEIADFNNMFEVPYVSTSSLDTKTTCKTSIQSLTESFVTKLQADFPSTVSTIYRTSEKLQTACKSSAMADHCDRCLLCMCALVTSVENASALNATQISKQLSQTKCPESTITEIQRQNQATVEYQSSAEQSCSYGKEENCGRAVSSGGCCSFTEVSEVTNLQGLLCYSCQLTIKDMSSVESLPMYILSEAKRRQRRAQMREGINEFLLDDSDEGS